MKHPAKEFTRKVLLAHAGMTVVLITVVLIATQMVYSHARTHAMEQARQRQVLVAQETGNGIQSYYNAMLADLDLVRRTEDDATIPIETRLALRQQWVGTVMWRQLEGRISELLVLDRATLKVHRVNDDHGPDVDKLLAVYGDWLRKVDKPAISPFMAVGSGSVNLICVPLPQNGRLLVAVVPLASLEKRFFERLPDPATSIALIDEFGKVIASSDHRLKNLNIDTFLRVANLQGDEGVDGVGSNHTEVPIRIGDVLLTPHLMTRVRVAELPTRHWAVLVSSQLSDIDSLVRDLFREAVLGALMIIAGVTAILGSTSFLLIRSRTRMERRQHDILTKEVAAARRIQMAWLPGAQQTIGGVDIAAANLTANHVSGDFYNWFALPDGRTAVVIGDVSGHGMPAAFLMATTQLLVRTTMQRVQDPGRCLQEVNAQLCQHGAGGQFVTMLIMVLDGATGEATLATAGHPAPLVFDGLSFQPVAMEPQFLLGIEPDATYQDHRLQLPAGAHIVLYTDGVVELRNASRQPLGLAGLQHILAGNYPDARTIVEHVVRAAEAFRGTADMRDDLTLVGLLLPQRIAASHAAETRDPASTTPRAPQDDPVEAQSP